MADSSLKYGTKVIGLFGTITAVILAAAVYYNGHSRLQIKPQDIAELTEGRSERMNVTPLGIAKTNRIVLQIHRTDLTAPTGIDADLASICTYYVDELAAGTDHGWSAAITNYVMYTGFTKLVEEAMDEYNPETNYDEATWLYVPLQVRVIDLHKRQVMIDLLKSTVTTNWWGDGTNYQKNTSGTLLDVNLSSNAPVVLDYGYAACEDQDEPKAPRCHHNGGDPIVTDGLATYVGAFLFANKCAQPSWWTDQPQFIVSFLASDLDPTVGWTGRVGTFGISKGGEGVGCVLLLRAANRRE